MDQPDQPHDQRFRYVSKKELVAIKSRSHSKTKTKRTPHYQLAKHAMLAIEMGVQEAAIINCADLPTKNPAGNIAEVLKKEDFRELFSIYTTDKGKTLVIEKRDEVTPPKVTNKK